MPMQCTKNHPVVCTIQFSLQSNPMNYQLIYIKTKARVKNFKCSQPQQRSCFIEKQMCFQYICSLYQSSLFIILDIFDMLWDDLSFATHSSGLYMKKPPYCICTRRQSNCLKPVLTCKSTTERYHMLSPQLNAVTKQGLNLQSAM